MRTDDAFGVLGLTSDTPMIDVRRRYHALIKELHPDLSGQDTSQDTDQVSRVIEAYQCIREQGGKNRYHRGERETTRREPARMTPRTIFTLGRWAATAADRRVRLHAVRRLADSGLQSAAVFLRQAIMDGDREIASSAAEGFLNCAGVSAEQTILDMFDKLSAAHRLIVLAAIEQSGRIMPRVLSWAQADPNERVRNAASRIQQHSGGQTA